ncbi:YciI family protein [Cognatilysobacter lacus]|uniref:YciI family protein n=1 Tax=Cognatilysobacter lacus TaxID=1643323 RepID=A0A5D8Z5T5_9GAMM|nr:YciI family protein [Lysobacter lacus]TZF90121.1 YciI family protein [Lysobacter lacus]
MQFMLLVYIDDARLAELPDGEFDRHMRECLVSADALRAEGRLLDSQQLEPPSTARAVRHRDGAVRISDGPFAETKEFLAGFNLIEAADLDEAVGIAEAMPWTRYGAIEVRAVRDIDAVRRRVGAGASET